MLSVSDPSIDDSIAYRIEPTDRIVDPKFESKRENERKPLVLIELILEPFNAAYSFPASCSSNA